jgi:hypothetical protein
LSRARLWTAVAPLFALAAAAAAGCSSTKACKDGTLFLTVALDPTSSAANQVKVDVLSDGRSDTYAHPSGSAQGTVEIDFPHGYTAGTGVQVRVTALDNGVALGIGTGSVTLASGCSTLTVNVGAATTDGSSGDGPHDGSAADGPVDHGCVFQSAEDCFNGVDDDCNGLTDCADPACNISAECVAGPGTSGSFELGVEVDPTAACPTNYTGTETALNQGLSAPATDCTGCSCSATTSCSLGLYSYTTAATCNADATLTGGTLVGTLLTNSSMCNMATLTAPGYRIGNFTKTDSACTAKDATNASPGTGTKAAVSWTTQKKFCPASRVGGGCSPGYVCAPKRQQITDHCVRADGNLTCPTGYNPISSGWYKSVSDTRACGACTCGTQTPGDCTKEVVGGTVFSRNLGFWTAPDGTCSASSGYGTTISTAPGTKTCCALQCAATACGQTGANCAYFGFVYPPQQASCPAASALSGTVTAAGPETLCCL